MSDRDEKLVETACLIYEGEIWGQMGAHARSECRKRMRSVIAAINASGTRRDAHLAEVKAAKPPPAS